MICSLKMLVMSLIYFYGLWCWRYSWYAHGKNMYMSLMVLIMALPICGDSMLTLMTKPYCTILCFAIVDWWCLETLHIWSHVDVIWEINLTQLFNDEDVHASMLLLSNVYVAWWSLMTSWSCYLIIEVHGFLL